MKKIVITQTSTAPAKTPAGKPGIRITCTCTWHKGISAILPATAAEDLTDDTIHGNVLLAHHPLLSRAESTQKFGPWKA
jgi:hypothetical protein